MPINTETVQAFLDEIGEVCRRHGITIEMVDPYDGLTPVPYTEEVHKVWTESIKDCMDEGPR